MLPDELGKLRRIFECHGSGDIIERRIGVFDQFPDLDQSLLLPVMPDGHPGFAAENPVEVLVAQMEPAPQQLPRHEFRIHVFDRQYFDSADQFIRGG